MPNQVSNTLYVSGSSSGGTDVIGRVLKMVDTGETHVAIIIKAGTKQEAVRNMVQNRLDLLNRVCDCYFTWSIDLEPWSLNES